MLCKYRAEAASLLWRLDALAGRLGVLALEVQGAGRELERLFVRMACEQPVPASNSHRSWLARLLSWAADLCFPKISLPPSTFAILHAPVEESPDALCLDLLTRKLQVQTEVIRQLEEGARDRDRIISELEKRLLQLCLPAERSSFDSLLSTYATTASRHPSHAASIGDDKAFWR
eukprot:Protomagalhaensia_wolfi_Nauph_80__2150@NODE_2383_length_1109_cov_95_705607_g1865_i0_p1_GENE_NODE_2383_length_1109_cov_95_705607_g1865_i0NODE_2383_length_1109_cov_95_705607_g1865_i0_p1_ORF_typecomplete_len175_score18_40ASD2/PF08687_11/0_082Cast/PF10174_9/0_27_NODE_2383_length_1109_cov_95_705607_g1865_i05521076